jgi:hypothetical protein
MAALTVARLESRSRADAWRSIRMEAADRAEAQRAGAAAAEARQSLRQSVVSVDAEWLRGLIETVADGLYAQKLAALKCGQFDRSDRLADEIDALTSGFETALRKGRVFGGRR